MISVLKPLAALLLLLPSSATLANAVAPSKCMLVKQLSRAPAIFRLLKQCPAAALYFTATVLMSVR
jgi:hypothetical protein